MVVTGDCELVGADIEGVDIPETANERKFSHFLHITREWHLTVFASR